MALLIQKNWRGYKARKLIKYELYIKIDNIMKYG